MKLCAVLNASAGSLIGGALDETKAAIEQGFAAAGHDIEVLTPQGDRLVQTLSDAAGQDFDAIIIGGGDGTIATAGEICARAGVPLGVLPLGTMNLMAKDLGIPLVLKEAIAALGQAEIREIDMGEVNGTVFLCNSTLGIVPMIGREREAQRGQPWWRKLPALAGRALVTAWYWPGVRVTLEFDGQTRKVVTRMLAIANNAYETGPSGFLNRTCLDAGVLTMYVSRHRSRLGLFWFSLGLAFNFWHRDRHLETITTREVTITSHKRSFVLSNDGEIGRMRLPLTYRIRPKALKVLVPKAAAAGQSAAA